MNPDSSRPAKRMNNIKILVGDDTQLQVVRVPKDLLTTRSGFSRKACLGESYTTTGFITLPSVDPEIFSLYLQVLYTNHLVLESPDENLRHRERWLRLMKTYFLAENLEDPESINIVTEKVVSLIRRGGSLSYAAIRYVYDHTQDEGHALRRLFVDFAVEQGKGDFFRGKMVEEGGGFVGFLSEVVAEFVRRRDDEGGKRRLGTESVEDGDEDREFDQMSK